MPIEYVVCIRRASEVTAAVTVAVAEDVLEEQIRQPAPRRQRKYGSVRSAVSAIQALIRREDAGLSALDPEEAVVTVDQSLPTDYAPQTSYHAPIGRLIGALRDAQKRSVRHYDHGQHDVPPDDLWQCWARHRIWGWSLRRVADWLEGYLADDNDEDVSVSRQAVKRYRVDRGDGYVETELKARGLWSGKLAEDEREARTGAEESTDEYEEAM